MDTPTAAAPAEPYLRDYVEADLDDAVRIVNGVIDEESLYGFDKPLSRDEVRDLLAQATGVRMLVSDGVSIGLLTVAPLGPGHMAHGALACYALDPVSGGGGLGKLLVQDSVGTARNLGFDALAVYGIDAPEHGSVRPYEPFGFERIGTLKQAYRRSDGQSYDVILFNRSL